MEDSLPSLWHFMTAMFVWGLTRVGRDTLQKLLAGEAIQSGVYPVQPPDGFHDVLPDLIPMPLPDVALVQNLAEIRTRPVMERNRLFYARSKLDPAVDGEDALLNRYERDATNIAHELQSQFNRLQEEAMNEDTSPALEEWSELWKESSIFIQGLANLDDVNEGYKPQPVLQPSVIDDLLIPYLNRRYRDL